MGLFLANEVKSLYVGNKAVVEVYLGSEKIWGNENLICTYDIDEPGEINLCSNISIVQSMIVDGVSVNPSNTYNFEEAGEHTVEFVLTDKKLISRMFSDTSIKSIVIPNSVTSIGDSAFRDCVSLQEITLLTTQLEVGMYAFRNLPLSGVLKVPAGSNTGLESYLPEGWTVEYI